VAAVGPAIGERHLLLGCWFFAAQHQTPMAYSPHPSPTTTTATTTTCARSRPTMRRPSAPPRPSPPPTWRQSRTCLRSLACTCPPTARGSRGRTQACLSTWTTSRWSGSARQRRTLPGGRAALACAGRGGPRCCAGWPWGCAGCGACHVIGRARPVLVQRRTVALPRIGGRGGGRLAQPPPIRRGNERAASAQAGAACWPCTSHTHSPCHLPCHLHSRWRQRLMAIPQPVLLSCLAEPPPAPFASPPGITGSATLAV
jgi:hypothetical protein